jgi:hypothetical protein
VRTLEDYSSLDRKALYRSAHSQLLANALILHQDGRLGIQLGHPLVHHGRGQDFGCQAQSRSGVYDRMEMTFMGTGISANGETPQMTVDSLCKSDSDLNHLDTVWIPAGQILQMKPEDQTLPTAEGVVVRLKSIPDQWPEDWVLWSVRFYRTNNPENSMTIDNNQLRKDRPHMLSLQWKAQ